ncbi:unnamed protein product [Tuber melanosporum]|uniref:(Perigord truffle) hypothetical protein n=1 Tax=Tuber melanosporum (strain Mel28) TaxID=656061 RepID=D5G8H0_TUBMM|nr:uncharacterized protein GSTUM_00002861001 [Tuber melanosporum]CAZ80813.1 unnamed protein product [Tuber melanosporum]
MSRRGKKSRAPVGISTPTERSSASAPQTSAGGSGIHEPPHEVAVRFADLPGDHNSPLYSFKTFEDLGVSKEPLEASTSAPFIRLPLKWDWLITTWDSENRGIRFGNFDLSQLAIPDMVLRGQGNDAHIIVRILGMALDLIRGKQLAVEHLKGVVLDETDNMLDLRGVGEQCLRVKQNIASSTQIALLLTSFLD